MSGYFPRGIDFITPACIILIIAIYQGGSHDRTEMLPLKAGVCIMSLGAMNAHKISVKLVPCGLNYFKVEAVLSVSNLHLH